MIIRYAEEKNFIELRQFYDGMCKVLSGKDFLPANSGSSDHAFRYELIRLSGCN